MVNLEIDFAGKALRNPFGVASMATVSGTGTKESEPIPRAERLCDHFMTYADAGAGYIVTPVINHEEDYPQGMIPASRAISVSDSFGYGLIYGCANFYANMYRLKEGARLISLLKKRLPDKVPVVVNMMGPGDDAKGWAEFGQRLEDAGGDFLEMSVAVPFPAASEKAVEYYLKEKVPTTAGLLLGDMPLKVAKIVEETVKKVKIPVGIKVTSETGMMRLVGMVELVKNAGGRFVTSIGGTLTVAPPDIYNGGKGQFPFLDGLQPFSPITGPANRIFVYRNLTALSKFVPGIDLAGVGGIMEHKHTIEAIMLGAKMVQLSSGVLWGGLGFLRSSISHLKNYMERFGYNSVEDFRGLGLQYIVPTEEIDWKSGKVVAVTDPLKCNSCGKCIDNICLVRGLENSVAVVSMGECHGCGFCAAICPQKAITLQNISSL